MWWAYTQGGLYSGPGLIFGGLRYMQLLILQWTSFLIDSGCFRSFNNTYIHRPAKVPAFRVKVTHSAFIPAVPHA
jgi:hypothetical protein